MFRYLTIFVALVGGLIPSASAQYLLQQKDLSFAQAAAGPTIETVLTFTNRGDFTYKGVLRLTRGPDGLSWNPLINGERITGGEYTVEVGVDAIVTLHITDDPLRVGQAVLVADDTVLDNFVEGTLTYYVRSGETIKDSVGLPPGLEFYLASLPFEHFHDIGLALANPGATESDQTAPTATASVTLINPAGEVMDTQQITLVPGAHVAQFLYQLFEGVEGIGELTAGKIEIASATPIVGTALTQVSSGQISSLPLNAAPVEYTLQMTSDGGDTFDGTMALWVEGFFVKGYLLVLNYNDQALESPRLTLVHGQLLDRYLDLSFFALSQNFFGTTLQNVEMSIYFGLTDFGLESSAPTGRWVLVYTADQTTEAGTLSLSRVSP